MNLVQRFQSFIQTMSGFEDIDKLLRNRDLKGKERADYLLSDRTIIVEQKVLIVDPSDKPQKFVEKLMQDGRLILYGTHSTKELFNKLPDGQELERKMFRSITQRLERCVAKADGQTRDTREIFDIPKALGVLVILNESAPMLRPDVVDFGLRHAFLKTDPTGSIRYPNNDGVLVISEAHALVSPQGRGSPCLSATGPHCRSTDKVTSFFEALVMAWSSYNNLPVSRYS